MNEREIFDAALRISEQNARLAFLRQACGTDDRLREQIEGLLRAEQQLGSFLAGPLDAIARTIDMPRELSNTEGPGKLIGPYKLLEQIGEGGFGIVFLSEQQQPIRRKVALKILKPGMDSRQVIARFEAERQALALMDHPHIAKVLDAGATDTGRPYFVMELVKGVPITDYCDTHQLTPRERLELFVPVCKAVQHAHQKGIIHRDIKPSNVLVTRRDSVPVVKVIDFGIAKALGQELTDKTLFTGFGQMIGTPLYMSPEQADSSGLDIDTRTDVYSLGVLLYELLTGTTPFDKLRLRAAAFDEIRRIIREDEPPKPSTRLSDLSKVSSVRESGQRRPVGNSTPSPIIPSGSSLASVAALRKMEPRKLSQLVRGELDWIVMKALEKDRNRRYETANGFGQDIQRYLSDEPVSACPPSVGYRFQKFARKNKAALAIGTAVITVLLMAIVGLSISNTRVRNASSAKELALEEKSQALSEKTKALGEKDAALRTAVFQEGVALKNAQTAEEQRQKAAESAAQATLQERLSSRRFYVAQINLAQQAFETGDTARVLELLENHRPRFDQEDLRGFEWYYLWGKCHRGLKTWLPSQGRIAAVAFAPDHQTVAVASSEGHVALRNANSGALLGQLVLHDRVPRGISFSSDGTTLAVGTDDGVELWDWIQQRFLNQIGHQVSYGQVAFFPGERLLACMADDWDVGTIRIWDTKTGSLHSTISGAGAKCMAIAPDGQTLASGGSSNVVFWQRQGSTWNRHRTHENLTHAVVSVAFSSDGTMLAASSADHGTDHSRHKRIQPGTRTDRSQGAQSVSRESPDGLQSQPVDVAIRTGVRVWDVATGVERVALQGRGVVGWVGPVAFTPDNRTLAVANHRSVLFYDLETGLPQITPFGSPSHTAPVRQLHFSLDGRYLATAAATNESAVKVFDRALSQSPESLTVPGGSWFMSLSADEQTIFAGSSKVIFWNSSTGKEMRTWDLEEGERAISSALPYRSVIATVHRDFRIGIRNLETGRELMRTAALAKQPYDAVFSPDGNSLALPTVTPPMQVWDLVANRLKLHAESPRGAYLAGFSPDGRFVAAGCWDGAVRLYDPQQGQLVRTLTTGSHWTTGLAFSPNSQIVATANRDGTVGLWNPADGTLRGAIRGHGDVVTFLRFFPDGKTLVAGTEDGLVKLWDLTTQQELLTFPIHSSKIIASVISRDGGLVATNSTDGQIRLHHANRPPEAIACKTEIDLDDPRSPVRILDAADEFWAAGQITDAIATCNAAHARLVQLVAEFPQSQPYRHDQVRSQLSAILFQATATMNDADLAAFRETVDLYRVLPPSLQRSLIDTYYKLGAELESRREFARVEQLYTHLSLFVLQLSEVGRQDIRSQAVASLADAHLAALYEKTERKPAARALCRKACDRLHELKPKLATEPDQLKTVIEAWTLIGQVLRDCENYADATAEFSEAIELHRESPAILWNRAIALSMAENYELAILDYSKLMELMPSEQATWSNRGRCYFLLGRLEDAAVDFSHAIELPSHDNGAMSQRFLAIIREKLGQIDQALAAYSKGIDLSPTSADLRLARGQILQRLGRHDEALADFRKAVELDPCEVNGFRSLSNVLFETGRFVEAVEILHKACELFPEDLEFQNGLGMALLQKGRIDEARARFERALKINPGFAMAHYNLGKVHRAQGRRDDATKCYLRALEIDPRHADAQIGLGEIDLDKGEPERAIDRFRRVLELNPQLASSHSHLGAALFALERWDEARACFQEAVKIDPKQAVAMTGLANSLLRLGRFHEAIDDYLCAIQLDPSDARKFLRSLSDGPASEKSEKNLDGLLWAYQSLREENPGAARLTTELARLLIASECVTETLTVWTQRIDSSMENPDQRASLGRRLWELSDQAAAAGRVVEAEQSLRCALEIFSALAAKFPDNVPLRHELGNAYGKLRMLLKDSARPEAEAALRSELGYF